MSKGLTIPAKINVRGDFQVTEGPELLRQHIILGVTPAGSNHPWNQKLTPREDLIFDIADSAIGGELAAHIYDYFDELKRLNLATISKKSGAITATRVSPNTGDYEIAITYTDLEDSQSREIIVAGGK